MIEIKDPKIKSYLKKNRMLIIKQDMEIYDTEFGNILDKNGEYFLMSNREVEAVINNRNNGSSVIEPIQLQFNNLKG